MNFLNTPVKLSTALIGLIGLVDLVTTIQLLRLGGMEGNPLFGWLLQFGLLPFALAKLVFLLGPILLIEWARIHRPESAEQGAWIAVIAYLGLWGYQLLRLGWLAG